MKCHLLCAGLLAAGPLWAATSLFDFENEAEVRAWHDEGSTANTLLPVTREPRFATSGDYAMCFRSPRWQSGMAQWPACEAQPPLTDWSGHDRLVFDVTNATAYDQKLLLFLSSASVATRDGLLVQAPLAPHGYRQVVVPLSDLAGKHLDPANMRVLRFFTESPPGDMALYLDNMVLLKPGEAPPTPAPAFVKAFAATQAGVLADLRQTQQAAKARASALAATAPAIAAWAEGLLAENSRRVEAYAAQVERGDSAILQGMEAVTTLRDATQRMEAVIQLRTAFEKVRQATQVQPGPPSDLVVGFATSMEKVLPRAGVPRLRLSRRASLSLARNEKEALQVIVMPCERAAKQVGLRVSDLRSSTGAIFAASHIQAPPMGYVQTKSVPPYGSSHVGWWPDPILDFMSTADIAVGDAQSFWLRVRAPKDQPPGRYRGKLEVLVAGTPVHAFDLAVEVYPFAVPDRSPLPLAVTFAPMYYEPNGSEGWLEGSYRDTSWQRHKLQWGDFLADYYLSYDSLYHKGSPDFEVLQRLHRQGRLGMFNLGYYDILGDTPAEQEAWRTGTLVRIKAAYEQAKALGLLDHAYIYGCDENPPDLFPGVQRAAEVLRRECPGALILTTTYDHSFGTNSVLQSMDGFCPLTPSYNRALADRVRATGKQVWWYICCGPSHPFCNMFIEYPAIEGRLLMGAQTAKERPDGFLYYEISIWNSKPITSGPFTDWDPRSWTTFHGDGSWTCLGPDGTPLPTIRLENFRDGLEDYAYARLLEQAIQRVEGSPSLRTARAAWLTRARAALEVPAGLTRSMTEYTHDPAKVYRWRRAMAQAIAESGVEAGE
jgi:hypothetical protein